MQEIWAAATRCANWMVSELYARDVRRQPQDPALAPMPHVYLYPEARALFPELSAQSVAALAQEVYRRYRAARHDLLWTRTASLPTYRYPVACTAPTQAWSLHERDGRWVVSVRLGDGRWELLLRGGSEMRRQSDRLRQIRTGQAERGPVTIYLDGSARGRQGGISAIRGDRVMVKIVAWFPRPAAAATSTVLDVRTDETALLRAGRHWHVDPAPLRGVLAVQDRRRRSLVTNLQIARTHPGQRRDRIRRALAALSLRSQRRLADACRTYAAHLAAHAVDRGAGEVRYDDSVRSALPHFPWEQLRRRISEKLDEHGIRFVHVNGTDRAPGVPEQGGGEHAA